MLPCCVIHLQHDSLLKTLILNCCLCLAALTHCQFCRALPSDGGRVYVPTLSLKGVTCKKCLGLICNTLVQMQYKPWKREHVPLFRPPAEMRHCCLTKRCSDTLKISTKKSIQFKRRWKSWCHFNAGVCIETNRKFHL